MRAYTRNATVSPFISGRAGALISSPSGGSTKTDYLFGLGVGGEYFIDRHFSFGVEAQVNIGISDTGSNNLGNPGGTNINTATVIFGTIYF